MFQMYPNALKVFNQILKFISLRRIYYGAECHNGWRCVEIHIAIRSVAKSLYVETHNLCYIHIVYYSDNIYNNP